MLYYCPESEFFYARDDVVKNLLESLSKFAVHQEVKKLIFRVRMEPENLISEKGSSEEKSLDEEVKLIQTKSQELPAQMQETGQK